MICLDLYSFTTPASRTPYMYILILLLHLSVLLFKMYQQYLYCYFRFKCAFDMKNTNFLCIWVNFKMNRDLLNHLLNLTRRVMWMPKSIFIEMNQDHVSVVLLWLSMYNHNYNRLKTIYVTANEWIDKSYKSALFHMIWIISEPFQIDIK